MLKYSQYLIKNQIEYTGYTLVNVILNFRVLMEIHRSSAHGVRIGKTLSAYSREVKTVHPKKKFTVENAVNILDGNVS